MNYTPYDTRTDEELLRLVATNENPTDLELELANRLESALMEVNRLSEITHADFKRVWDRVHS